MRHSWIGFLSAIAFTSAMATPGCSSNSGGGGAGDAGGSSSSSSSGGSSGSSGGSSGSSSGGSSSSSGSSGSSSGAASAGDGGVSTLGASRSLGSLTTSEAAQLCSETYAYFGRTIGQATTCKWAALKVAASSSSPSDSMLEMFCSRNEAACNDSDAGASPMCDPFPSPCTATVAQYSACISDEAASLIQTVNGFPSCAMLKGSNVSDIFTAEGANPPASCMTLSSACAGINQPNPLTM